MRPGHYSWQHSAHDHARVRVSLDPQDKIEVSVWWNNRLPQADIILWVPLHINSVEFGDLTGNQYGTPLHRKGLGTFAVNLAVQVLQKTREPTTRVKGILSNPNDNRLPPAVREGLAEDRRRFWSRFGLSIVPAPADRYEGLTGTVGSLRCVTAGHVAGQFPRYVPLAEFTHVDGL